MNRHVSKSDTSSKARSKAHGRPTRSKKISPKVSHRKTVVKHPSSPRRSVSPSGRFKRADVQRPIASSKSARGGVDRLRHGRGISTYDLKLKGPLRDKRPSKITIRRIGPSVKGEGRGIGRGRSSVASGRAHGSDRFKHVTSGSVARRINLAGQYKMRRHGDVARRMGLHKGDIVAARSALPYSLRHASHHGRHYHRGRVSPFYGKSHFGFHFRWPSYYRAFYSYPLSHHYRCPRWSPWVHWSWHYRCGPLWDPRPIYCRPWVYQACPRWVWWKLPVWEPLPVVASGTWVDVEPVQVAAAEYDLQLLAVRFVDAGHPREKLGPRYRVWFRGGSDRAIASPFDIVLLAGNDEKVNDKLPMAGVRINSIEAGQTQSVDIRLPFEVLEMGQDKNNQPVPFTTLHVLVDANREIDETSEVNNGTRLTADLVLPVDPSAFEAKPKEASVGGELLLAGEGFGPEPGRLLVHLGGIEMEAEILGWYDLGVRLTVPRLPLAGPVETELIVIRRDGVAANPLTVTIKPEQLPAEIVPPPPPAQPMGP
ncbi:MAG: hypothetical protein U9N87_07295 [Planctomycetota bacterium]|nr:hypothetical protein [Planctomycetota bacterium]